jgi:LCP family protein required for cell wall assembly
MAVVPVRVLTRVLPAARVIVRVLVGLLALVVLAGTGYGWVQLDRLSNGLTTADVIDHGAQSGSGAGTGRSGAGPIAEQNLLLVGVDTRTDAQGDPLPQALLNQLHAGDAESGGDTTDTMIVVHIPAGGGRATAISIPRDSYVDIADGSGKHKINSAFHRGKLGAEQTLAAQGVTGAELARRSDEAGGRLAIQTVQRFTGLTITHYAAINLVGFDDLSQAIGGVQVCLAAPVKDSYSGADFPAGVQTLSGAQALAFVRQRHGLPNGDLDRIARQQVFLAAMAQSVLSAGTLADPAKIGRIVAAVQRSVVLDQGWDLVGFAEQINGLTAGEVGFVTIPVVSMTLWTPYDGDAVQVDPVAVRQFVAQLTGQASSGHTTGPAPTTTTGPTAPGTTARRGGGVAAEPRPPVAGSTSSTAPSTTPAISSDQGHCVN